MPFSSSAKWESPVGGMEYGIFIYLALQKMLPTVETHKKPFLVSPTDFVKAAYFYMYLSVS
jgi:hypothetical protein